MKKIEEIFNDVCDVIENSTGYKKEDISMNDTLFDKLEIDSIDLVDRLQRYCVINKIQID